MFNKTLLTLVPIVLLTAFHAPEALATSEATAKLAKKLTNQQVWKNQHYEVQMQGKRIGTFRLVHNTDGRIMHEAHPYGHMDKSSLSKVKRYTVPAFMKFIKAQAAKERAAIKKSRRPIAPVTAKTRSAMASTAESSTTTGTASGSSSPCGGKTCTKGLGLGYNPSTGYIGSGSTCFNEVTTLNAPNSSSQFSVATGASSYASQTQASASISGSYGLFSASADATYSNNYATSSNSGSVFFSAAGLYTAVNAWNGLNTIGNQSNAAGTFGQYCGSNFISSAEVGGFTSVQFGWSTTTSSASQAVSASLSASASSGLGSISGAVSAGQKSSSSSDSNSYSFSMNTLGGGTILSAAVSNAQSNNASLQNSCETGSPSDCVTWAINYNAAVVAGISGSNGFMASYANSPTDLTGLMLFPNPLLGVGGQSSLQSQSISLLETNDSNTYSDVFESYAPALNNYIAIYNQIQTLSNRANYLYGALSNYQSTTLNVSNYIQPMINQYADDAKVMLSNIDNCLTGSTSSNLSTICEPITTLYSSGVKSAYQWYGSNGPNPNNYASYILSNLQNNTIALQYTGTYKDTVGSYFNMDAAWISQLPGSGGWNPAPVNGNLYSLPALVGFVDSPWTLTNTATTYPYIEIMALNSGNSLTAALSNWLSQDWSILGDAWSVQNTPVNLSYINGCTSTSFSSPCTLNMNMNYNGLFTSTLVMSPINDFFGP